MDYKKAGVNIAEGNRAVSLIKESVNRTHTSHVLSKLGGFAAGFKFPKDDYEEPILVSCTDGVGTKLCLAIESGIFDTVGIDLVAMNVNDLICMGAKPLFFLDYIACHKLIPEHIKQIIDGMVTGCLQAECALIGGEMAEMNDMYKPGDFDLAGFCVGVVDRKKVIDGRNVKPGDKVYGFASSGIHSNGYSLVRKILTKDACRREGVDRRLLMTPTKIYVRQVLDLIQRAQINSITHITGGGLKENIERGLPEGCHVLIKKELIRTQDIFKQMQELGSVPEEEMYRVFNMGVGMVVITQETLEETDEFYKIGDVVSGERGVSIVQ